MHRRTSESFDSKILARCPTYGFVPGDIPATFKRLRYSISVLVALICGLGARRAPLLTMVGFTKPLPRFQPWFGPTVVCFGMYSRVDYPGALSGVTWQP